MSLERIHKGIVKTRYFLQACLVATSVYGCAKQAHAAYVAPQPSSVTQEPFSALQLRTAVIDSDQKALEAQFVGKKAEALRAYGISAVPDLQGVLHYQTGYAFDYFYPGDGPNWPRHGIKGVEFKTAKGVVSNVSLYGTP